MNEKPNPIAPDDWISHHLARQQSECPTYGELLEDDGRNAMSAKADPAYSEWLAEKVKDQEDLAVERMPWWDEEQIAPDDIPYPYGG